MLDRLVTCTTPEGEVWHYRYDPFGRRLTKVRQFTDTERAWASQKYPGLVPEAVRPRTVLWTWPKAPRGHAAHDPRPPVVGTHFLWDGDVIAEEAPLRLDGSVDWEAATRWHYEPKSFLPPARQEPGSALLYIVTDHLGTPREMMDEAGQLRWAASLTTWGVVRRVIVPPEPANDEGRQALYPRPRTSGNLALNADRDAAPDEPPAAYDCPIRFQGQWADAETGLYYNRHRHYDPIAGQYTSTDPIGMEGSVRPQAYVTNPVSWIDSFGLAKSSGGFSFTQTTASPWFSTQGKFSGSNISDVVSKLRSGILKPGDVPVEVIIVKGRNLIVNTRSSLALRQAGIDPKQWRIVDRSTDSVVVQDTMNRLSKNGLGEMGTDTLRITEYGGRASTFIGSGNIPQP